MRASLVHVSILLVSAAVLSGCLSAGPAGEPPADSTAPTMAPPGQFDDSTGAISGIVLDPELVPLADVDMALASTEFRTQSAQDGSFSFSRVPPGEYGLLAAKLGFHAVALRVAVQAGQQTPGLRVVLEPLPVVEPRVELYQFKGYITCTIATYGVLSEECGEGLQTDLGTYGRNPNNKIDWKFNVTDVQDLQTMFLELDWDPASAAASELTLYVAHKFRCTPGCGVDSNGGRVYCGTSNHGPPAQKCQIDELGVKDLEKDLPWSMTSRAWGAPRSGPTEMPIIVLEQSFDMYRTEFFGEPMPADYSAVPDR